MNDDEPAAADQAQRVLILAPGGRDAAVVGQVLASHGIRTAICASETELVAELERGAAAAFVLEEALSPSTGSLKAWIGRQPPWSDFPFVVLVARRSGRRPSAASGALKELGNVMLLERPLNGETLVTAALSALRARTRQYAASRYILEEAQARVAEEKARAEVLVAKQALEVAVDAGELGTFHCPFPFESMQCSRRCWEHFWLAPEGWLSLDRFYSIVHAEDREQVRLAVRQAINASEPYDVAFRALSASGEVRWIRAKGRVYRDSAGQPQRFDGVTFDITRQKRLEEERESLLAAERQARLEAEKAGRMKDEFLATLSHELRTPLSAILGWTYLLGRPNAGAADVAKAASTIERNARAQARLIEELLDISRITSGNLKLQKEPVAVPTVFDAVVQSLRPALQAKDITVEIVASAATPVKVLADPGRLQQVVWNLVSNAIKFTERGGRVVLGASASPTEVTLTVSDSGMGIAPEFLPHVFERFRQADSTEARSFGGLGLGLAIVRQLVELHGGSVSAHSDGAGHGARFEVRLPALQTIEIAGAGGPASEGPERAQSSLAGVHVLLVDDEDDGREMLAMILLDRGARVAQAASAEAALQLLDDVAPTVLVSDIGMPRVDGYEFIRRVRKLTKAAVRQIPAIALTAFARPEDVAKARHAGFDLYMSKPVNPAELVSSILQLKIRSDANAAPPTGRPAARVAADAGLRR